MATLDQKIELRGDIPRELGEALEAISQAKGFNSRHAYVLEVLMEAAREELHAVIRIAQGLKGNPLLAEVERKHDGSGRV